MKRFLLTCLVILSALPSSLSAQTPVATPDPFMLPINQLVLRIREGNGFEYMRGRDDLLLRQNYYQVKDGIVHEMAPPSVGALYTEQGVQDLYISSSFLVPEHPRTPDEARIGITIDTRLVTFEDGDTAGRFVNGYQDSLERLAGADPEASQDIAVIPDLPEHQEAIIGVTGMDPHDNLVTEQADLRVPFAHFLAVTGTTVTSVQVASPDLAFNDAVARELLTTQLSCLTSDQYCVPVPLPAGVPYEPGTPVASPVAQSPERRIASARFRV